MVGILTAVLSRSKTLRRVLGMRRKLATLEVWEDDGVPSSGLNFRLDPDTGELDNRYEILLNPKERAPNGERLNMPTVFAHELGHFLAHVLKAPEAIRGARNITLTNRLSPYLSSQSLFARDTLREEKEAWELARLIYPGLNETQAAECLRTYERNVGY